MATKIELDRELELFDKELPRLISAGAVGKFVLIGDGECVGVWDTYEDALQAGYQSFGLNTRFMVKKIEGIAGIQFFTRDIAPCQASRST
jgi:hypothetical protein